MGIYDLNNVYYLEHDIKTIFESIDKLYRVEFKLDKTHLHSKTLIDNSHHWTSDVCKETFNNLVPAIKSLHKDMYALLETIFISKTGKFNKPALEIKYQYLKEFRLLNNKFKHFNDKEAEINLTEIVLMEPAGHVIDIFCTFIYPSNFEALRFSTFIEVFLKILEDENIISISRS